MQNGKDLMPDSQRRLIKQLKDAVQSDNFNLARTDHDAIELRIDQLEQFIADRYLERSGKTGQHQ